MSATDLLDAYLNDTVAEHNSRKSQLTTHQASGVGIVRGGSRQLVGRSALSNFAARADKFVGSKQGSLQHSRSLVRQTAEAETAAGDCKQAGASAAGIRLHPSLPSFTHSCQRNAWHPVLQLRPLWLLCRLGARARAAPFSVAGAETYCLDSIRQQRTCTGTMQPAWPAPAGLGVLLGVHLQYRCTPLRLPCASGCFKWVLCKLHMCQSCMQHAFVSDGACGACGPESPCHAAPGARHRPDCWAFPWASDLPAQSQGRERPRPRRLRGWLRMLAWQQWQD